MPTGFWIEIPILVVYVLGMVLLLPRIRHRVARRAFIGFGLLLLAFILLQIAAFIYLALHPIKIDLRFG